MQEKIALIKQLCKQSTLTDPIKLFDIITHDPQIRMHGPEHHIIDGACVLTAAYNTGMKFDLNEGLEYIAEQGMRMPGAMCGMWGVCGAVTSVGAALAFMDSTSPLSTDGSWGKHMMYTSYATALIAQTKGPRCCKRDGAISIQWAVKFLNNAYGIKLTERRFLCDHSAENPQCIKQDCPFYGGADK